MPVVAIVDGVKIMFFFADHAPPHFHVWYGEYKAQIVIENLKVLQGQLPPAKLRAVREWAAARKAALHTAWRAASARRNPGRIQ